MAYQSLYRKYRSQTFGDLIGQDHVVRTLQNAISSSRIAHSFLFTGPRGTGKTSTARLLAKALCCEKGPTAEPCNECEICLSITQGSCVDVIEMDAASESGVDDIREQIVEAVEYQPMVCRYKVFIIDEVHDLSSKAFDALLKTVEEPPPHIVFILATTEFNKVPPTIRSRCQKHEFHRASMADLVSRLQYVAEHEGVQAEPQAVSAIARMADGGYRDALTLLEQAILTSDGHITLQQVYDQLGLVNEEVVDQILVAIKDGSVPEIMDLLAQIARLGRDPRAILESLLYRLSDLTRASYQLATPGVDATREASLHETAARVGRDSILRLRGDLAEAHKTIRDITLPRLWLESELVRLSMPTTQVVQAPLRAAVQQETRAPRPVVEQPKPKIEEPHVTPEVNVEVPAPASVAVKQLTPDTPHGIWQLTLAKVPEETPMGRKLQEAVYGRAEGNTIIIELSRQFDYDWMHERPQRIGHLNKLLQEVGGEQYEIRFEVTRNSSALAEDSGAVELPLEGGRLEQLMKDIFGQEPDPPQAP